MIPRQVRDSASGNGGTRDSKGEVGMEKPTVDKGSKGLDADAAPAEGAGMDVVPVSCSACCIVPFRGRNNVAAGGMSCCAAATVPGGDSSVGCGLV